MVNVIPLATLLMVLFKGAVYNRGDEGYDCRAYQYATTSSKDTGSMNPAFIVYAQNDNDVISAIQFARERSIAVAIRTGGHQYCGASSTSGNNMQLDLSKTYPTVEWEDPEANDHTVVTFGVSTTLGALNSKLKEYKRFLPTGQCSYVHLGGHCQTGGYGASIRAFGLLSDHIQKLRIITADKDVHKDEDHPLSRGVRGQVPYSRDVLKKLVDLVLEMGDDDDFPADYDMVISMVSERPAQYADNPEDAKILIYAQWANLEGPGQDYDPTFFKKLLDITSGTGMGPHERVLLQDEEAPMSEMTNHWIIPIVREFQLPYIKNVKASNLPSSELRARKYTEWVTERIDMIEAKTKTAECYLVYQFGYGAGRHSRFARNGDDGLTSFSWRDSTFVSVLDVFYNKEKPEVRKRAEQFQKENEVRALGKVGKFSDQDRRLLWGSQDSDLDEAKEYYFDESPTKYKRLTANKARFDPHNVFTPNNFSVRGAAPCEEGTEEAGFKKAAINLWQTITGASETSEDRRDFIADEL
ncbi:hypothetical protein BGZ72_007138 [Mortierella alpina]|nr:hypothetical protein BGZ72_007138 [Mortierella alpina]